MKNHAIKTENQDSFLPLHLIQLNKRRAIKPGRGDSRRKSPRVVEIIFQPGKIVSFLFNLPGKVISGIFSGIISLMDSALWAITGISPWIIIPFLALLIIFGPSLVVAIFHL